MTANEIVILIPALTGAVVSIINAWRCQKHHTQQAHQLAANTELTAQTKDTATAIQTLVNGQSEAMRRALALAQAHIVALEAEHAQLKGQP